MMENAEKIENTESNLVSEPPIQDAPSLKEAIEESKESIASAEPIKRGRGRPKKDAADTSKKSPKKEAHGDTSPGTVAPPVDVSYLEPVVNLPFQAMAYKTGWPGWELNQDEKKQNAIFLDAVMRRYLPQLQTQHAELVGLAFGLGFAFIPRYMQFKQLLAMQEAQKDLNKENQPENKKSDKLKNIVETKKTKEKPPEVNPGVAPNSALKSVLDGQTHRPSF